MKEEDIAIFWDVENLTPGDKFTIDNVVDDIKQRGRVILSWAFADWVLHVKGKNVNSNELQRRDVIFVQHNFDIMQTPKISNNKNFADHMMIDRISETLEYFPHVDTYVIVARDGDFRQISRAIRKRGKHVIVYTDPSTANTTLLEVADKVIDVMNLGMEDELLLDGYEEEDEDIPNINEEIIHSKVIDAIKDQMKSENKESYEPINVSYVLTRLKAIYPEIDYNLELIQDALSLKKNGWWKQLLSQMEEKKLLVLSILETKLMVQLTSMETIIQSAIKGYSVLIHDILKENEGKMLMSLLGTDLINIKGKAYYKNLGFTSLGNFLRKIESEGTIQLTKSINNAPMVISTGKSIPETNDLISEIGLNRDDWELIFGVIENSYKQYNVDSDEYGRRGMLQYHIKELKRSNHLTQDISNKQLRNLFMFLVEMNFFELVIDNRYRLCRDYQKRKYSYLNKIELVAIHNDFVFDKREYIIDSLEAKEEEGKSFTTISSIIKEGKESNLEISEVEVKKVAFDFNMRFTDKRIYFEYNK